MPQFAELYPAWAGDLMAVRFLHLHFSNATAVPLMQFPAVRS
jgi:hypothetical protein